jgi:hypothetical protein
VTWGKRQGGMPAPRLRWLAAWAEEFHPEDDDASPASLLANAGEQLSGIGDHDAALGMFRLADELRRERPADGDVYLFIGEDHELKCDLCEAHRWMTMGLLRMLGRAEDGDDLAVSRAAGLVRTRARVRGRSTY